jgi:hypothetical protein
MANILSARISNFIASQFPQFLQEDDSVLIEFVELYYEWMEATGNPVGILRTLPTDSDVDTAPEAFLDFLRTEFLEGFPKTSEADPRILIKNIASFFKSKGTEAAYKLLFEILFNESVTFYYPGRDILRVSDGKWVRDKYLSVNTSNTAAFDNSILTLVKGRTSGATARFESLLETFSLGVLTRQVYVSDVRGTFVLGETIYNSITNVDIGSVLSAGVLQEAGHWNGTDGHLSSNKFIQDSDYYQEYSYVIQSTLPFDTYDTVVNTVLHPTGTKMFGEFQQDVLMSNITTEDIVLTLGNPDSGYTQSLDYDIVSGQILTGDYYSKGGVSTSEVFLTALTGNVSMSSNTQIGAWSGFTAAQLDDVPIGLFGNKALIRGTGTNFYAIGGEDDLFIQDTDNSLNLAFKLATVYSPTFLSLTTSYPLDFTDEHITRRFIFNDFVTTGVDQTDSTLTVGTFTSYQTATDGTSIVTTGLGAVAADERPVVAVIARAGVSLTITSVTIGGVALKYAGGVNTDSTGTPIAFYIGALGQTGQATINFDVASTRTQVGMWPVKGLQLPITYYSSNTSITNGANASLLVPNGGLVLGGVYNTNNVASFSWNGTTSVLDTTIESSHRVALSANVYATAATVNVAATTTGTPAGYRMATVCLR